MQVNSIRNYNISIPNKVNFENKTANMSDVTFVGKKEDNKALKIARDFAIASMFLAPVATTPLLTGCEEFVYAHGVARVMLIQLIVITQLILLLNGGMLGNVQCH